MKRNLALMLTILFVLTSFTVCALSGCNNSKETLKINAPTEVIEAELGSYDLPEYQVVNEENLIKAGYEVVVKKIVDPNGNEVTVAYNKINATIPGIYTITYGVTKGNVPDVDVKISFADRSAPTLDIDEDVIPKFYIKDMRYSMPAYQLTGNPDFSKCWAKIYYLADKNAEPQEVTVVDNYFTVEHNIGYYRIVIHAEDAIGNANEYSFNVEATGPSQIVDGKILYFDEKFGVSQVTTLWGGFDLSYTSEVAYGDEAGSMKVVTDLPTDYILLDKLLISNVSEYTHIVFRIYNANENDVMTGFCWMGDTKLKAGQWTEIMIPVEWLDIKEVSHPQVASIGISSSNIRNLAIRLWDDYENNTVKTGSTFYLSAMYAIKGQTEPDEVVDGKIVYLDEQIGLNQVSVYWPDAHSLTFDETVKFGDEAGSLKVTYNHAQEFNYLIIDNPYIKDISDYNYIKFNVYNPTEHSFNIQLTWSGEVVINANGWTEVTIPISAFAGEKIVNMQNGAMSAIDITSLPIYFDGADFATDECFYISAVYAVKAELGDLDYLPAYDGAYSIIDCGDDTHMLHCTGASVDIFDDYCDRVVENGFRRIWSRISQDNYFATFVNDSKYVYVYYTNYNVEMRVMTGPAESLIHYDYSIETSTTVTPYIASVPQPAQGEGYVVRLPDGRFIVQDGGYEGDDRVYSTLRQLVGDEEIVIAAWFISHPHADHYPAFIDFIKEHADDSDVTVERVIYNYGHIDMLTSDVTEGDPVPTEGFLALFEALEAYAPDIPLLKAHTGQEIEFGNDASVEILYTIEDHIPTTIKNPNDSSMVIRVKIGEDTVIFLNYTGYVSGPILHNLWGAWLQSDIMQIAHHGMWPSVESIYHDIKAEVVLVPNLYKYFKNYIADSRWVTVIDAALSYAKDLYVSGDKMIIHELPYVIQNNKGEMYDYIINYTGRDDYKGFDDYEMNEGDIAPFDKFVDGYTSIGTSYGTAEYTTEQKFGDEAGSLKLTVARSSEVYLTINFPYTTDLSEYDYIVFNVYNPTDADITAGVCWAGDTVCTAGQWTEVRIPVSNFDLGKIDALTGKDIPITNICGLVLRLISGFEVNDVFYISAVRAEKAAEKEPVAENIATKFDSTEDLSTIKVHWSTAHTVSIDNTVKHGDDEGSLKVVAASTSFNYIIVNNPYNTDFSAYDYISFWVYNPGSTDFSMGTTWAADTVCKAGEWTEVRITKEMFELSKVKDMNNTVLSMSNITNLPLRLISNLAVGDTFYISSLTAGKEAGEVEETVAENIVTKFDNANDLNTVDIYWDTAHSISIDTTVKHGDDNGSLKVVKNSSSYNYISVVDPYNTDFSAYDYISFWVYNPGSTDFSCGTNWQAHTVCTAGEWTEIKVTKEMFDTTKVHDMNENVLTMSDITNFVLRIDFNNNLASGDIFYISSVVGGKDTE